MLCSLCSSDSELKVLRLQISILSHGYRFDKTGFWVLHMKQQFIKL